MRIIIYFLVLACTPVAAETFRQHATHTLGERETQEAARAACINAAGASAMEDFGNLIQSRTSIATTEHDGKISEEASRHVESFIYTFARSKLVRETWDVFEGHFTLNCDVDVTFDKEDLKKGLEQKRAQGMSRSIETAAKNIDDLTARAKLVKIGMTKDQVLDFVGPPIGKTDERWQYGETVVRFNILTGVVFRIEDIWGN